MTLKHLLLRSKATTNIDSVLECRDTTSPIKVCIVKVMVFPVVTYRFENRPIRRLRNWCLWIVVLEKTLESPVDCKEIKPVYPKGNQTWIVSGRTDAEAEAPILWPADVKNLLIGKTLMLGKIEAKRRWGWWNMRWLDKWRAWHAAVHEVPKSQTWLSNMKIARNALGKWYLLSKCQLLLFLSLLWLVWLFLAFILLDPEVH